VARRDAGDEVPVVDVIGRLDEGTVRRLLVEAAEWHEDVLRAVRLAAADDDDGGRLEVLRAAVDDGLRTRRHLDYWGSSSWAQDAAPVVDALGAEVAERPSAELVVLLQRAAGHLVKVILRADDSNGMIGGLARDVLELHRVACTAGVAEPRALAKWMVRFAFDDQDFFEIDPVAYVGALGDDGLSVYRREVAKRSTLDSAPADRPAVLRDLYGEFPSFAAKYAAERLAVIDGDVDRLVELLGGDLSSPHQFTRVVEVMIELGRPADALAWARRGIAETSGWQVANLYDLAAGLVADTGDVDGVVELRRHHHERAPSSSTYAKLQTAARADGTWDAEVTAARAALAARDTAGLIDALLADGDTDEAWKAATPGDQALMSSQWQRLAEARERTEPHEAMEVYLRLADEALEQADKRAYRVAVRHLKAARRAAKTADRSEQFAAHLAGLRERNRRRPTLIAILDTAGMT
jgi:hypothetical protein